MTLRTRGPLRSDPRALPPGVLAGRARVDLGRCLRDLLAMSRPRFWLLSVAALHIGFVLATHRILPRGHEIATLAHAGLVAGPLVWLAVLSVNDAFDLDGDRRNSRRADSPLVNGRISPHWAIRVGVAASLAAVLAAVSLGGEFTLGTIVVVSLGWAYSTPPLRLKARAGADVIVNAFAVGMLGPLGGWVAVTGTIDRFPWPLAIIGMMAMAALYLPTTVVDRAADHDTGDRTTAVVLGARATFELGFAFWAGSAMLTLWFAVTGVVIDASLVPLHLIMTPILLILYRVLLKEQPSVRAIGVVAGVYLVPCIAFVLTYVESI